MPERKCPVGGSGGLQPGGECEHFFSFLYFFCFVTGVQVLKFEEEPVPRLSHVSSFGRASRKGSQEAGGRGEPLGFFRRPTGVALQAATGLVFVADAKHHRVQTLRLSGDGLLTPLGALAKGAGFAGFKREPGAIAIHPTHPLLVVAEQGSQCLHEFAVSPAGSLSLRRSHCGKASTGRQAGRPFHTRTHTLSFPLPPSPSLPFILAIILAPKEEQRSLSPSLPPPFILKSPHLASCLPRTRR